MVFLKNLKFHERFVFCKIHPQKVFGDALVRKQAFLDNKNMDLNTSQIGIFAKSMILVKKMKFFHLLCLSKIDQENVFPDVRD